MGTITRLPLMALLGLGALPCPSGALAAPTFIECGRTISTTAKAVEETFTFATDPHVAVPGGLINVNVPAGKRRCIKVTFTAIADCANGCFIRADDNNVSIPPRWDHTTPRFTNSTSAETHSFTWIKQAAPGAHQVIIRVQTGATVTDAHFGPYTTIVEVMADPP